MKRIIYTGLLSISLLLGSCSDFLDKSPYENPDAGELKGEEVAIALTNGAYQPLQRPKLYNFRIWTLDIVAGDSEVGAGGGSDGLETINLSNFVTLPDNFGILDIWRGPNPGILYCNTVIESIPKMDIDQTIKDKCIGEAKFLRAHYYFVLVRLFGDVPMQTVPLKPGDNMKLPRTDKNRIYNEIIIPDLKDAMELLPTREEYKMTDDVGRASKGAAAGMLAKVYLALGDYENTVKMCEIVDKLGYTLNSDYSLCFGGTDENKNTAESLFEIQYLGFTKADFWGDDNQANWLSTYMGPRNSGWVGGGYGWNQPTQEFVNQYESGDLRKDKTVLYEGCPPFDNKFYKSSMSNTGYNVRKFLVPLSVSSDYNTNSASVIVLRYADVLLMKAEALNEQGYTENAEEPLFQVRKRAGLTKRSDVENLTLDEMREKIRKERRVELAFEGHRWFDLIRYDNGKYALDFWHSIGKVNAANKHLLMPIPQDEIDANSNLKQNPGY